VSCRTYDRCTWICEVCAKFVEGPEFDDVTRINFRFRILVTWSSQHGRITPPHQVWCKCNVYIQSGVIDIFRHSRWRPPPSWFFYVVNFAHSIMLRVKCLSCIPNFIQSASVLDVHLMTSRELTSGFDFWSCDHHRMAVVNLSSKFGADIFIQSGDVDTFRNSRYQLLLSCIFKLCELGTFHMLEIWCSSCELNLVQIALVILEIDAFSFVTSVWWHHVN